MAHEKFLNPTLSIDSVDTFVIRTGLLNAVKASLPSLHGTLLDVGCGEMPYRDLILEHAAVQKYIGLDIRNAGYQRRRQPDLFWDGRVIPLDRASVDSVIATELFEHLPDLDVVLREISRVLKPGGALFFTVPFLWPLHDSPYDFCRYTPFALRQHLEACDFDVRDIAALGGWNASLAQMIGLWINRSGLAPANRQRLFSEFEPFYKKLVASDRVPAKITDQSMSPGFHGIAIRHDPAAVAAAPSAAQDAIAAPAPAVEPDALISVCIPTYNRGGYIADCLKSVLDQSDGRIEVLVIDDGSTDNTEEIVRNFGRPEIRYVRKAHTNGSDTRNVAVAEATGEFILWVDSDDLLLPGALKAHRAAMAAYPGADVFYGNLKIFGDTRRFPAAQVVYEDYWGRNDYLRSLLVSANRVPHGGTSVRRALYDRVGVYNPEFTRAHDYEFWTRAADAATFKHVGGFTYLWRWHDSNMSSSSVAMDTAFEARALKAFTQAHTIEALFPFLDWHDRNSALIYAGFQLAKAFLKWRDTAEAFAWIERAVGVITPDWRMPDGTDEQRWKVVQRLVDETFMDDPQTRAEFAQHIDAMRVRRALAPVAGVFDRAFYEKKLIHLVNQLKAHPGSVAITEQLRAELLRTPVPRVPSASLPLVSVVIPFYRQADTIAETLASLGAQTYRHFEVLIASDGDEAFPAPVLTAFQEQHPDIPVRFEVKPHSGLAGTRNWAIERARGTYILPLDSDDLIASIFLDKTVRALESHPALSFVYVETVFFGEKNEIWAHVDFDPRLLLHQNLMTCTTLFRRDMWAAIGGYNENMTHGYEDWDFWIGAVERGFRATNLHLPLFMYRRKKQSMLEARRQFDRAAKAQIVANHPALYRPLGPDEALALTRSAIGRIPESLQVTAASKAAS